MEIEIGYNKIFSYDYVWVNDGNWRRDSDEQSAISQAKLAGAKAGLFDQIFMARRIIIDKLPCNDKHKDVCSHLRVSFWE